MHVRAIKVIQVDNISNIEVIYFKSVKLRIEFIKLRLRII